MLPNIVLFAGQDAMNDTGLRETNGTGSGTFELAAGRSQRFRDLSSGITVLGGRFCSWG
jgi:hypothetical protein